MGYSDVSPGIGMRHLEGPKNPYELNLGIHIVTRHCMKGGSRRTLGGLSGKRTPSKDLWRVLNGSFVQPCCRVSPCTLLDKTTTLAWLRYRERLSESKAKLCLCLNILAQRCVDCIMLSFFGGKINWANKCIMLAKGQLSKQIMLWSVKNEWLLHQ